MRENRVDDNKRCRRNEISPLRKARHRKDTAEFLVEPWNRVVDVLTLEYRVIEVSSIRPRITLARIRVDCVLDREHDISTSVRFWCRYER